MKPDGTRWCTVGEVKGNMRVKWVASSLALYHRTRCIQHYYRWCAHLVCQQSTELPPRQFKWTRPFRWKTKSGFCACAITFQMCSTSVTSWIFVQGCTCPPFLPSALQFGARSASRSVAKSVGNVCKTEESLSLLLTYFRLPFCVARKLVIIELMSDSVRMDNSTFERVEEFKYLGTTLTNQNAIQAEIKSILRSGNACYYSVRNLLSSRLLSEI